MLRAKVPLLAQAFPPNCFVLSVFDSEELSSFCACSPTPTIN